MDLGNIKVGDSLELHCYKHNGKINTVSDKITIIDIKDDGQVFIATSDAVMAGKAKSLILAIAEDLKVGNTYNAKGIKVTQFGAFVEVVAGKEGLIHISKLSDKRVDKVEDVVNLGDNVIVEVIKIDDKGRVDMKLVEKI